jgi:hypothetical protein
VHSDSFHKQNVQHLAGLSCERELYARYFSSACQCSLDVIRFTKQLGTFFSIMRGVYTSVIPLGRWNMLFVGEDRSG